MLSKSQFIKDKYSLIKGSIVNVTSCWAKGVKTPVFTIEGVEGTWTAQELGDLGSICTLRFSPDLESNNS